MTTAWPIVSLGDLIRLERRPVQLIADREYQEIGIYSYGRGIFHKRPRSGIEVGDKDLYVMKEGDLIFQITFAWEGAIALCSRAEEDLYGSVRYPTYRVDDVRCFAPFLVRYLCTRDGLDQINRICPGSAGRNRVLALKRLPEIMVPLPPLDEQSRIVARIDDLAARIAEARGLRRSASHEVQALFRQHLAVVFSTGAPKVPLGDETVCQIICGQHLTPEEQSSSGIPYITGPADFTDRTASPSRFALSARACSADGDVLLTVKGAGVGKTNLAPMQRTAIGRQLFALRPRTDRLESLFLWYFVQHSLGHFRGAITATTVPGIGREDVEALQVPLPSLKTQRRIVAELDALQADVHAIKALQSETAAELDALLPAILDKAFKGEL
jgi:type I restriction enzyme S subunit